MKFSYTLKGVYGIPIFFIHGFELDRTLLIDTFENVFRSESTDFRRIYFDLPGMGQTPIGNLTSTDDIYKQLINFIDSNLYTNEKFIVCANSYGAYLGLGLIKKFQNQILGMFLLSPLTVPNKMNRKVEKLSNIIVNSSILDSKNTHHFFATNVIISKTKEYLYRKQVEIPIAHSNKCALKMIENRQYALSFDIFENSSRFKGLITVILGKQDNVVGYKNQLKLKTAFRKVNIIVLKDAGHNVQIDQFSKVVQHFKLFLKMAIKA
jgi:pimeloyl-ACP methyl ester carboxylesterase